MSKVNHTRIYADADGESHFEEVDVDLKLVEFAPPAPPGYISAPIPAARLFFGVVPPGYCADWHPTPFRQLVVYTAGEVEFETSDGGTRRIGPGSIVLVEDTTGKGHRSRVVGAGEAVSMGVQLSE